MNFDQLKLLPGTALQLEFHQSDSELKEPSSFVGCVQNRCLIVSVPLLDGESKALKRDELVDVSLYSDILNCAVIFSVQIIDVIDKPLAHAYLSYPAFIAKDEARKAQRISTSLIAKVKSHKGTQAAKIIDLSISGCKLTAVDDIGPMNSKLLLATRICVAGNEKLIQLKGIIKGVLAKPGVGGGDVYQYGISFNEFSSEVKSSLLQYIDSLSSEQ